MKRVMITTVALLLGATTASAQEAPTSRKPEIRPFVGVYVPTGAMRDAMKAATTLGAQGAVELTPRFHVVGTAAWTHGHHKFAASTDRVNLWQYDVGLEVNPFRPMGADRDWMLRPFVGLGAGGRTAEYREDGLGSKTCTAGYGALGSEVQRGAVALRLEARDYLTCFESPITGTKKTRNDATIALGVAFHLR